MTHISSRYLAEQAEAFGSADVIDLRTDETLISGIDPSLAGRIAESMNVEDEIRTEKLLSLTALARDLWITGSEDEPFTREHAISSRPEYLRGQVELINAAIGMNDNEGYELVERTIFSTPAKRTPEQIAADVLGEDNDSSDTSETLLALLTEAALRARS